jgi:hypothetical protein
MYLYLTNKHHRLLWFFEVSKQHRQTELFGQYVVVYLVKADT